VAEAIHCPSCTTRYRLRPERLKPAIRRAQCCSCGGVFPIGDLVQRLLAPPAEDTTAAFAPAAVEVVHHEAPPAEALPASLSAGDLEGTEDEILEKTLVTVPSELPEAKAGAPILYPPEITETTLSGYTSARDAIEKLFGGTPATATGQKLRQDPNPMDMEATLSALDSTLGPSALAATPGDLPTDSGLAEEDLEDPSKSTLRLSQADLLAALAAAPAPKPTPSPAEPTVPLRASDLVQPRDPGPGATAPVARPFLPQEGPDAGAELLRLKIGEDIYGGLTMPQLIAWVEEGRVLENHLVARQHSENWLEAQKVPGLRPIFDRLRRERSSGAPTLPTQPSLEVPPKKSLFGGLFGKN
jgi:zinc-ribbon domain